MRARQWLSGDKAQREEGHCGAGRRRAPARTPGHARGADHVAAAKVE
jgi:hypothetical protein